MSLPSYSLVLPAPRNGTPKRQHTCRGDIRESGDKGFTVQLEDALVVCTDCAAAEILLAPTSSFVIIRSLGKLYSYVPYYSTTGGGGH
ncbi:hypothetical protein PsYK624_147530 [Phanerochaete sordida]|uniref:Uncharacterized protein n=1 Tax=Phanerochaete sordida TaxID=48140 RepID=A0A9P3GPK0_9APHY|nr:hypothetical protein PsYK624_147530 [Phanerochaete sordida]